MRVYIKVTTKRQNSALGFILFRVRIRIRVRIEKFGLKVKVSNHSGVVEPNYKVSYISIYIAIFHFECLSRVYGANV